MTTLLATVTWALYTSLATSEMWSPLFPHTDGESEAQRSQGTYPWSCRGGWAKIQPTVWSI